MKRSMQQTLRSLNALTRQYRAYPALWKGKNANQYKLERFESPDMPVPKIPVPNLSDTLDRYLSFIEPLLSKEAFAGTKTAVENFRKNEGPVLQGEAKQLFETTPNYIEGFWDSMYLDLRCPLPLNVSPFIVFNASKRSTTQTKRAAEILGSLGRFNKMITNQSLPQDRIGKVPLCMHQYGKLFGTSRVPKIGRDVLRKYDTSDHVVVMARGHFYKLRVLDIPEYALVAALDAIVRDASEKDVQDLGILTAMERDDWAMARDDLKVLNTESLEDVESALAIITLDDVAPTNEMERAMNCFYGGKTQQHNRFYDKLQFHVMQDASAGMCMEHTGVDGHTLLSFVHYMVNDTEHMWQETDNSVVVKSEELVFDRLSDSLLDTIKKAKSGSQDFFNALDAAFLSFDAFGTRHIKTCKVSPDAFVQMAFQLTYAKLFPEQPTVSTYESANMKNFFHGRTETIRTASCGSVDFVNAFHAFEKGNLSKEELTNTFQKACQHHVSTLRLCQSGNGVDRHLYVLKELARQRLERFSGYSIPEIFTDPNYTSYASNVLSTSNVSTPDMRLFGFGPVTSNGFGVGYSQTPDNMVFFVSNYYGQSQQFVDTLSEVLNNMAELFHQG